MPVVLASLPAGFGERYAAAVSSALPHASPAALCYLLRAVSLDRGKRLLRANRWLGAALRGRAEAVAGGMEAEQAVVVVSCGAQLAWDPREPWLQVR